MNYRAARALLAFYHRDARNRVFRGAADDA